MNGNMCTQVFTDSCFTRVCPMLNKTAESIGHSLVDFVDDVGILCQLVMDLDPAQAGHNTAIQAQVCQLQIRVHFMEKGQLEQNLAAEGEIWSAETMLEKSHDNTKCAKMSVGLWTHP